MKTLITTVFILASTSVFAHDSTFSNDGCDIELNGGIKINAQEIQFLQDENLRYKIVNNTELIVDNEYIALDKSQQALVSNYSNSIRAVVPEVKVIALDAISLASDGVNLAFDELLGPGNDVGANISAELAAIRQEIETKFDQQNELYIHENGFSDQDVLGEDFDRRIEAVVEESVLNAMGSLMIAMGKQLLYSGGDMEAFESRMENFGENIESEMESRSQVIEQRAHALCQSVKAIDELEEQLQIEISELDSIDWLSTKSDASNRI